MAEVQNGGKIPGIIQALGKFLKGLKDYNLLELLKVLFAVFVFALVISFVRNPEMYIEKAGYAIELHENRLEREHAAKMNSRRVADQNISWYLNELRDLTGADRAWMLEPHNGGSNSTTGTSFYYLNLTADEPAEGYESLDKGAFKDIPYSEYPMADLIDKRGRWWGPDRLDADRRPQALLPDEGPGNGRVRRDGRALDEPSGMLRRLDMVRGAPHGRSGEGRERDTQVHDADRPRAA